MKEFVLTALLICPSALAASIACDEAFDTSESMSLVRPESNDATFAGMGSVFRYRDMQFKKQNLALVGRQGHQVFFIEMASERLVVADEDYVRGLLNNNSLFESLQSIDCVPLQDGLTCMPHALANGLKILHRFGGVDWDPAMNQPQEWVRYLDAQVGAETYFQAIDAARSRWQRRRIPDQIQMRQSLLDEMDVRTIANPSFKELRNHLDHGRPALVDLNVTQAWREIKNLRTSKIWTEPSLRPIPKSKTVGGHSVVAIGSIFTGWQKDPLIVVLDSGMGQIDVWRGDDLRRADPHIVLLAP